MTPKATTLSTHDVVFSSVCTWSGSSFWMGASCAIHTPSQATAKAATQRPGTLRVGSAKTAGVEVFVIGYLRSRWGSMSGRGWRQEQRRCGGGGAHRAGEGGKRVGGDVHRRGGGGIVAGDQPGDGETVGERHQDARDLGEWTRPLAPGEARGTGGGLPGDLVVARVLAPRQRFESGLAQRPLSQFEHRLLAVGVGAQAVEVVLQPGAERVAHPETAGVAGEHGREIALLARDGCLDEFGHQFVSRGEDVVEAGQRHPGLGDHPAGGGSRDPVARDHAERGLNQRRASVCDRDARHPDS